MSHSIEIAGKQVLLDKEGFLKNMQDWDAQVAEELAQREKISLTPPHWEIINLLRSFYQRHELAPANRALTNLVKRELGEQKGRSVYLMKLFGGSPAKLGSKISGLPKPDNCL